jgi:hypothetical protein
MNFLIEVIIIEGCLRNLLGASCLGSRLSASVVSVSISVVLRGKKILLFKTDFGGSLSAADVGIGQSTSWLVRGITRDMSFASFTYNIFKLYGKIRY